MSLSNLADFVLAWPFVLLYCLSIVAFFGRQWWRLTAGARAVGSDLRRLTEQLGDIDGQQGFVAKFEEYNAKAEQAFGLTWTEFVETLVMPVPDSGDPIRNTGDVSGYLNETTIVAPRVSLAFYQSVPNLLTGFGILGTFIGLSFGVGAAAGGVASGDPDQMTAALRELLQGASLAFFTSIAGVATSIGFVFAHRRSTRTLQQALDAWVGAIEKRLERVTPAGVALEQLKQQSRTARQVARFNTDLAITLGQALEEKVAGRLSPLLEKLVDAVGELRTDRSTDAAKLMEVATNSFTEVMEAKSGDKFDQMSTVLEDLNRTLADSSEHLKKSQKEVGEALATVVDSVAQGAAATAKELRQSAAESAEQVRNANRETAAELQANVDRAAAKMAAAADEVSIKVADSGHGLESATQNLLLSTQQSRELLDAMGAVIDQLNTVGGTIKETEQSMGGAAARMDKAADTIRQSSDRVASALKSTHGLVQQVDEMVGALGEYQEFASASWTSYQTRFEGIDASLAKVFENLDGALTGYCNLVQEFASQLDGTTSNTIQSLASATSGLNESIEELVEVMDERNGKP